jgi:NAD(P)H-dependent FMN reductase
MITIISATNRQNSNTLILAQYVKDLLQTKTTEEVCLLSLTELTENTFSSAMYSKNTISPQIAEIEDEKMIPAQKFIFVVPEYNGGFPGVLKHFVDALSIRDRNRVFKGKKGGLIGISTGRAGNLRGIDHFSTILNYLSVSVFPNLLPISVFNTLLDAEKNLAHEPTQKVLDAYLTDFLAF